MALAQLVTALLRKLLVNNLYSLKGMLFADCAVYGQSFREISSSMSLNDVSERRRSTESEFWCDEWNFDMNGCASTKLALDVDMPP